MRKAYETLKPRTVFVLVLLAMLLGYFSALSDNVYSPNPISNARWLLYAIAGVVNDFTIWLVIVSVVAWRLGLSLWQAIVASVSFSLVAIMAYLTLAPMLQSGSYMVDSYPAYLTWFTLELTGGVVGGFIGYYVRRWPMALFPILALASFRVFSEPRAWQSSLGTFHHVALLLVCLAIVILWITCFVRFVRGQRSRVAESSG